MKTITFSLAFVVAAVAQAQDLKSAAVQNTAAMNKAMVDKDAGYFQSVTTPDYHVIDTHGKRRSRAQEIASVKQSFATKDFESFDARILKVVPKGSGMVVEYAVHATGSTGGKVASPMVVDSTMSIEWVKRAGGWKMASCTWHGGTRKVAGKAMKL